MVPLVVSGERTTSAFDRASRRPRVRSRLLAARRTRPSTQRTGGRSRLADKRSIAPSRRLLPDRDPGAADTAGGLVRHSKLDETAGTDAADSSGGGHTVALNHRVLNRSLLTAGGRAAKLSPHRMRRYRRGVETRAPVVPKSAHLVWLMARSVPRSVPRVSKAVGERCTTAVPLADRKTRT